MNMLNLNLLAGSVTDSSFWNSCAQHNSRSVLALQDKVNWVMGLVSKVNAFPIPTVWWVLVAQDMLLVVAVLCIEPSSVLKVFPPRLYMGLPISLMPSSRLHR